MEKLFMTLTMSLLIFTVLTIPHLVSIFTFDFETGLYTGYVYPFWLLILIGIISGPSGVIIINRFYDKRIK